MRISWIVPALIAGAAAVVPSVAAAAPTVPAARGDFNGDGYVDLVIGAPLESIGSVKGAGAVNVLYGSATGPQGSGSQLWHQNVPGVAGSAESYDRFGTTVASGDFDRDGYADLAIGAPYEDIGDSDHSNRDRGAVHVLYGSPSGLTTSGSELWHMGGDGPGGGSYVGFGHALASGDFDDDGYADLAVGTPGAGLDWGQVNVLDGGPTGLTEGLRYSPYNDTEIAYENVGSALAAGDFDGSGVDDLAIGAPGRGSIDSTGKRTEDRAGEVIVLVGSASTGLSATGSYSIDQESPGVADNAEPGDHFGAALSAGDYDGDGKADLAVGVPGETVGSSTTRVGAVQVLPGSPNGLTGAGSTFWHRDGGGLPGGASAGSGLGTVLASADLTGDGKSDLAVGVGLDEVGSLTNAGSVNVVYGSPAGLTASFAHLWHQNVAGVPGSAEAGDYFGYGVGTGDYNRDGRADLAIGAPREGFSGLWSAGTVTVLRGGAERVTSAGASLWHQDAPGVAGAAETPDWFGASVAVS